MTLVCGPARLLCSSIIFQISSLWDVPGRSQSSQIPGGMGLLQRLDLHVPDQGAWLGEGHLLLVPGLASDSSVALPLRCYCGGHCLQAQGSGGLAAPSQHQRACPLGFSWRPVSRVLTPFSNPHNASQNSLSGFPTAQLLSIY